MTGRREPEAGEIGLGLEREDGHVDVGADPDGLGDGRIPALGSETRCAAAPPSPAPAASPAYIARDFSFSHHEYRLRGAWP